MLEKLNPTIRVWFEFESQSEPNLIKKFELKKNFKLGRIQNFFHLKHLSNLIETHDNIDFRYENLSYVLGNVLILL